MCYYYAVKFLLEDVGANILKSQKYYRINKSIRELSVDADLALRVLRRAVAKG